MQKNIPREYLPSRECWPDRVFPFSEFRQPYRVNVAQVLLDGNLERGFADRVVLHSGPTRMTYGELYEKVVRLASSLRRLSIGPGDRVMLRFPNCYELVISWLAVIRLGAIAVCTMPLLREREITFMVNDSEARFLIVDESLMAEVEKSRDRLKTVEQIIVSRGTGRGYLSLHKLIDDGGTDCPPEATARDDIATINYTSGSTGIPKGAVHFHEDLLNICESYGRPILGARPDDVFSGAPTMAFTYGMGGLLVIPLRFGASTVLIPRFSPREALEAIEHYRITMFFGSPTAYRMMLDVADRPYDLSSLRVCVSAGELLPPSVYHQWKERYRVELLEHIGSTEMLHAFISSSPGKVKPGSCGTVVPGYQARVVDENLNGLPPGTPGLLAVKGPTGCRYWRQPERQKEYVRDNGWNFPGDIFVRDEEGYFFYQCRSDDLIISGGYNIAGIEVEQTLMEHPAVAEAAVVGVPDPVRGRRVKAFVILARGYHPSAELAASLQDYVKNTLAPFKYPREVEFVDDFPRTETGKIRRVMLRQVEEGKNRRD